MRRRDFLGLSTGLLAMGGCQLVEPVWNSFTAEVGKANDMLVKPFRSLRIMSYNIRAGRGMDDKVDISRAAAVIKRAGADFVAVEEVDRNTRRSGNVDQVEALSQGTGMVATWCKSIDHDGGEYGIALLSREEPLGVRRIELPLLGKNELRMLLLAEFPECLMGVTHLSLKEDERLASVDVLRSFITPDKPYFLAGDWNDRIGSDFIRRLRVSFALLSGGDPTYPAPTPDRCIDYIAVSRRHRARFEHVSHEVLDEPLVSDHRPIVVTLR